MVETNQTLPANVVMIDLTVRLGGRLPVDADFRRTDRFGGDSYRLRRLLGQSGEVDDGTLSPLPL